MYSVMHQYNNQIKSIPEPLNIYRMLLKGDHLHFGYWPDEKPLLSLEEAQNEMFRKMSGLLPDPPAKILDVGCGLGASAAVLASHGYEVSAIAPSEALISYAESRYAESNVRFLVADFMDSDFMGTDAEVFDAIFMQESLQYLHPLEQAILNVFRLLKPKGTVVIGDEVCLAPEVREMTSVHMLKDIITLLGENSFKIKKCVEVGNNVKQTCHHLINRIQVYEEKLLSGLPGSDASLRLGKLLDGWKNQKKWYEQEQFGYVCLCAIKDNFMVRAYEDGEDFEILNMFNKIFSTSRTINHWRWKFEHNPYGTKNIAIARNEKNDLAAHFCAYPVPMYCSETENSNAFLTAQAGDTMTNPAFRNIGLGKTGLLSRTATYFYSKFCKDKYPFIYGFNTGNIKKLGERYLGYKYIYPIPYFTLDLKRNPIREGSRINLFKSVSVRREQAAGQECDVFFQNVGKDYVLLVKRDSKYLNWRYFQCLDSAHGFYSIRKFGKLIGWAVFSRKGDTLVWGDGLFDKSRLHYLPYLLHYVLNDHPGVNKVVGWFSKKPQWWYDHLGKCGFLVTKEPSNLFPCFKFFSNEYDLDFLENNLFFTMGDSDLF